MSEVEISEILCCFPLDLLTGAFEKGLTHLKWLNETGRASFSFGTLDRVVILGLEYADEGDAIYVTGRTAPYGRAVPFLALYKLDGGRGRMAYRRDGRPVSKADLG